MGTLSAQPALKGDDLVLPEMLAGVPVPGTAQTKQDRVASPSVAVVTALLVAAIGLLAVAFADARARDGLRGSEALFWLGLLTIVIALVWPVSSARTSRAERLALLIVGVVVLYSVKIFLAPTTLPFTGDEFIHMRTAQDIFVSHHLFHQNPINLISPRYPGLELVAVALAQTAGLPLYVAGLIIIGIARLIVVLSLFSIFESITGSSRAATLGAFIYFANPNFLFEGSQFSYESLGLPLAVFTLFLITRLLQHPSERAQIAVIVLAIGATIPTHHAASYALALVLLGWFATAWLRRRPGEWRLLAFPVIATCIGAASWMAFVAPQTYLYLTQAPSEGVLQLIHILTGTSPPKRLFTSSGRVVAPPWERYTAFAAVAILVVSMPFAVFVLWRRHRTNSLAWVFGIAALAYPASLALRLTSAGTEASNRASEYVFAGLGLGIGRLAVALFREGSATVRRGAFTVALLVVFTGGVITGWARHARLPGPYLVAAGPRSVEPQGEDAATWFYRAFGPDHRVAGDRTATLLMATLGRQYSLTAGGGEGSYWPLYFDPSLGERDRSLIRTKRVAFVVIDRRLSLARPLDEVYVEGGEPDATITKIDLAKFDGIRGVTRIYDSGAIQIYNVQQLAGGNSVK